MQEKWTTVNGLKVRYLETDGGGGISLIVLHGWGSSLDSWRSVAQLFENAGVKTFVPDLPGFGETPEPKKPWDVHDYTAFVRDFSRAVGVEKFSLAGHSFGGQIAIEYAAKYSGTVIRLILIAAARIMRRRKLRVKILGMLTAAGNAIFAIPPLSFLRGLVQKIWYRLTGERDYYRASPLMKKTMRLVLGGEVKPILPDILMPTMILWGDADNVTPLADARIIHEKIVGSELYIFKEGGHDLNFKRTDELAREILGFIK